MLTQRIEVLEDRIDLLNKKLEELLVDITVKSIQDGRFNKGLASLLKAVK